jgi:hypothetical protein
VLESLFVAGARSPGRRRGDDEALVIEVVDNVPEGENDYEWWL